MEGARDPAWYRDEAKRLRIKAASIDDAGLRGSYVKLALEYERLAETLARRLPPDR
jgi:hypothetical protein